MKSIVRKKQRRERGAGGAGGGAEREGLGGVGVNSVRSPLPVSVPQMMFVLYGIVLPAPYSTTKSPEEGAPDTATYTTNTSANL